MYLFLYFLILTGFIFSRGFYTFSGVILIFIVCLISPFILAGKLKLSEKIFTFKSMLLILPILSILIYGGLYQKNALLVALSYFLLSANLFLSMRLISQSPSNSNRDKFKTFIFIFIIMILLRLFMIWSSPQPYIDVYDYLYKGAVGFLSGLNPYSMTYTKLYTDFTPDYYGYLPGMLYFTLPFVALFKDPRFTFVFAEIATALLLFKLSNGKKDRYLYSLIILNNPVSLYLLEQSYTESLIVLLFVVVAFLLLKKKIIAAGLIYGFLIATKQYVLFTIPLFLRLVSPVLGKLAFFLFAIVAILALVLPFMIWNSNDFIQDAILLQGQFSARYEGLAFFSFLNRIGIPYNFPLSTAIISVFWIFIFMQKKINFSRLFYLLSFLFLVFFFFNKWAFINYYYLCAQLLLVGGILDEIDL